MPESHHGDPGPVRAGPGPLAGLTVLEIGGIGPAPFCGMVLADLGADVVVVDRPPAARADAPLEVPADPLRRGKRSIAVDLKSPAGVEVVLRLVAGVDSALEGFRPGVAERLGVGPRACQQRNRRLVYGRMTGWGQTGPNAFEAGHDINYLALSGMLSAIGRQGERPVAPLNLVGDFGGGGIQLALGMVAAMLAAQRTGEGQVVDAAMVDGATLLGVSIFGMRAAGLWNDVRGTNVLDSGAPFYDVYECADGRYLALGAIEAKFYARLSDGLGFAVDELPGQWDRGAWPAVKQRFAERIAERTRDDWVAAFDGVDACVTPVLDLDEARWHPHNRARDLFIEVAGIVQPRTAPRFEGTPLALPADPPEPGSDTIAVLAAAGIAADEIAALREQGIVGSVAP